MSVYHFLEVSINLYPDGHARLETMTWFPVYVVNISL